MSSNLIYSLKGEQLSSVEFVQDYLQLHFDGKDLTLYIWPEIRNEHNVYVSDDNDYKNVLCNLIAKEVIEVTFKKKKELIITIANNHSLWINLSSENKEIIAEIGIFNDSSTNEWLVLE